jgi:hypothetical protein
VASTPTIDTTSTEVSFVGNLVDTYNGVAERMTLTAARMVTTSVSSRKRHGRWPCFHARRSPPR